MSASKATTAEAAKLTQHLDSLHANYDNNALAMPNPARGSDPDDYGFKAQYFEKTDHEKRFKLQQEYVKTMAADNQLPSNVHIAYDPKADIEFLLKRDGEMELYQFDNFITQTFNIYDPAHQKIIRELEPEYYERRWDEVQRQIEIEKLITKIKLFGIQTKEDLQFVYALSQKKITPPKNLAFVTEQGAPTEKNIKHGLLNPKNFIQEAIAPHYDGTGHIINNDGKVVGKTPLTLPGIKFGRYNAGNDNDTESMQNTIRSIFRRP